MVKIHNLAEDRINLHLQLEATKSKIREDVEILQLKMHPLQQSAEVMTNLFTRNDNVWVNMGVDFFIRRVILSRASLPVQVIVPFLMKNVITNYLQSHQDEIKSFSSGILKKLFKKTNRVLEIESGSKI